MSNTVGSDPKDQRMAELDDQFSRVHATIEALQERLRELQAGVETL